MIMSETKHTPTPWHINKKRGDCADGRYNYAVLTNEEGNVIIDCYNSEVATLCEEPDGECGYYQWDAQGEADISYALEAVNNHERLTQRVQELETALKSAASTAHYRGVLRGASDVCHGSFDECTNCARWKTILAGTEKEAAK
jgi:hypothetical protein